MKKYKFLLTSLFKKKKLCYFVILMFFMMFIGFIGMKTIQDIVVQKYEQTSKEHIDHNYLIIKSEQPYSTFEQKISTMEHVKNVYPALYLTEPEISYSDSNLIQLIEGKQIQEKNEIIVSNQLDKKIGEILELEIQGNIYQLQIVGIYDSEYGNLKIGNLITPIYASYEFMKPFMKEESQEMVIEVEDYQYREEVRDFIVKWQEFDISIYSPYVEILDRYLSLKNNMGGITNIMSLFCFLCSFLVSIIMLHDHKLDIAIMKSIGYSNTKIVVLIGSYLFLLFMIPFLIGSFLYLILSFFTSLSLEVLAHLFFLFIILEIIMLLIVFLLVKRINIIKLMKNR